jgi:hypothetical protein
VNRVCKVVYLQFLTMVMEQHRATTATGTNRYTLDEPGSEFFQGKCEGWKLEIKKSWDADDSAGGGELLPCC